MYSGARRATAKAQGATSLMSISLSPRIAAYSSVKRFASSSVGSSRIEKPATSTFDSVNGPSNHWRLPLATLLRTAVLLGANETTTGLIGNCLHILAQDPALWARARADRGLVDPILTETLRYASPTQRLTRVARRDVEIGGVTIGAGSLVDVMYGSANRDPAVYPDPDTFRVDRQLSEGMAFGSGIHFCLGAALARTEARIALNALLDRYARIELGAAPAVRQRVAFSTLNFVSLPLVLHRS